MADARAVFVASRRGCATVNPVRKLLPIVALMLLALLAWSIPTQAGGASACATGTEAACFSHAPGDADEAPADEHDTQPHHHGGCHGHHIGVADHDRAIGAEPVERQAAFARSSVTNQSSRGVPKPLSPSPCGRG